MSKRKQSDTAVPGDEIARRYLRAYERGIYTKVETVSRLVREAAQVPPSELAAGLTGEWLDAIRQDTKQPPQSSDDLIIIYGGVLMADVDIESFYAARRREAFDGIWNWHRYFSDTDRRVPLKSEGDSEPGDTGVAK